MQDSWVASVSKWFTDEGGDAGLQAAEGAEFFGIASLVESFGGGARS